MKRIRVKFCGECDVVLLKDVENEGVTPEEIEEYNDIEDLTEIGFHTETDGVFYMNQKYERLTWEDVTDITEEEYCNREEGVMYPNEKHITELGENVLVWDYIKKNYRMSESGFVFQHADNI
jgi:hypothetical protein